MFLQHSAITLSDTLVVLGQVEIIYETKMMDIIYRALGEKTYMTKNKILYIQEDGERTTHAMPPRIIPNTSKKCVYVSTYMAPCH
jgi:hypothetical protein